MLNGKCTHCGSDQVFRCLNGIVTGDKHVYVRNISRLTPGSNRMTYICTRCGYYENFLNDEALLKKIPGKWEKVTS